MKKILALCIVTVAVVMAIFGGMNIKNEMKRRDAKIESFFFSEGGYPNYYEVWIEAEDGKYHFSSAAFVPDGGPTTTFTNREGYVSEDDIQTLASIIRQNKVDKWDGFQKYEPGILDGMDFVLSVKYDNGDSISAKGYMQWPDGYWKGRDAIQEHLLQMAERLPTKTGSSLAETDDTEDTE